MSRPTSCPPFCCDCGRTTNTTQRPGRTRAGADATVQLQTHQLQGQIKEGKARIASKSGHADYRSPSLFETVMGLELGVAHTDPRSVAGLVVLLRQAFKELVPFNEGTENYEIVSQRRTYRAILTAIETLEDWQKAGAPQAPDRPGEERG